MHYYVHQLMLLLNVKKDITFQQEELVQLVQLDNLNVKLHQKFQYVNQVFIYKLQMMEKKVVLLVFQIRLHVTLHV